MDRNNYAVERGFYEATSIDINIFIEEYKRKTNILSKIIYNYGDLNRFESNRWPAYNIYSNSLINILFDKFETLIENEMMTKSDLDLIKCYVIEIVEKDNIQVATLAYKVSVIYELARMTEFFSTDIMNDIGTVEKLMNTIISKRIDISSTRDYFEFLEGIDYISEGQLVALAYLNTHTLAITNGENRVVRTLPSNKDIFKFSWYLDKFFKEEDDQVLINLFMPVLIWWKVTNVIPFRPSEFTRKLSRNCLIKEDGKYYLKVDRIKVTNETSKKKSNRGSIPILERLEITEQIYQLMTKYLECTSFDCDTKTFFSYKAYQLFKKESLKNVEDRISEDQFATIKVNYYGIEDHVFLRKDLAELISYFYETIIQKRYEDYSIEKQLCVGDTRHLAFMSLMLQGISPIEIAMLGGHTHLISQNHYEGHSEYYIESEILTYIKETCVGKASVNVDFGIKNLKRYILEDMPKECPSNIDSCFQTEDGIGYCTLDMVNNLEQCEEKEVCMFCKNWWCMPTVENVEKAIEYVSQYKINPLKKQLKLEESFLSKLFEEMKTVVIADMVEIDKQDSERIRCQSKKVRGIADNIAQLQKALLDLERVQSNDKLPLMEQ